jgi:hypothetical protein
MDADAAAAALRALQLSVTGPDVDAGALDVTQQAADGLDDALHASKQPADAAAGGAAAALHALQQPADGAGARPPPSTPWRLSMASLRPRWPQ